MDMDAYYMTGITDRTRGDADSVKYTIIARDIANNDHYVIGYDYQLKEILRPMIWGPPREDQEEFTNDLTHAWHYQDHEESEYLMGHLGVSIEYFEDFLKEHSGEWTYPDDVLTETPKN